MLLKLYEKNNNPQDLQQVVDILNDGGLIIYPTDTMYAIGCHGLKERAIERICRIKEIDPRKNNLSIICYDLSSISEYAKVTAEPETNYTFAGWYENDNLISKEKEYRFCVQNNRNLSAHFSKNANQGTQKPSSNTTKPSGNTTKAPSIKPFKATGKQIAAGKKVNLKAEIGLPDRITKQLTWKSSNTKVATVNADGVVTVKKKTGGKKVTITASNDKIKVSASWKVTSMKGIVKKVKITGTKTVKAGKSLKLKANVTATKKANKKLQWTSSNAKYATVNAKGVVKTKKVAKGKTIKITAMATDGSNKKATFKVKVK